MTITAYARHRGCALRAVQQAVIAKRITRNPDGKIESEQADRDWEANTGVTQANKPLRGPLPQKSPQPEATDADLDNPGVSFIVSRSVRERYEAKLKKLAFEEKQGNLLPRAEVEQHTQKTFQVFREAILNVPNRIAGQLAAESDPRQIHDLLETELRLALQEFAGAAEAVDDAA